MPFQQALLSWYAKHGRKLPWRTTTNPYAILVSEVMLQQTQVGRVVPKYAAWLKAFPDFTSLAEAARSDVLRMWSGLGYNNRAVRLHALAKLLVEEHGGKLPDNEEELRKLPGIGPYTAGAIMVFAHNKPGLCVDVNVERIMKRVYFPITKNEISDITITKKYVEEKFLSSFPPGRATDWGNCLMDFGSAVCTPTNPLCMNCPVHAACRSKGERPDEKSLREKRKQPRFLRSNRWWRGRILNALNAKVVAMEHQLLKDIEPGFTRGDEEKFHAALGQLKSEGLVTGKRRLRL